MTERSSKGRANFSAKFLIGRAADHVIGPGLRVRAGRRRRDARPGVALHAALRAGTVRRRRWRRNPQPRGGRIFLAFSDAAVLSSPPQIATHFARIRRKEEITQGPGSSGAGRRAGRRGNARVVGAGCPRLAASRVGIHVAVGRTVSSAVFAGRVRWVTRRRARGNLIAPAVAIGAGTGRFRATSRCAFAPTHA